MCSWALGAGGCAGDDGAVLCAGITNKLLRTENNNHNDEDAAGVDRLDARSVMVNKMLLAAATVKQEEGSC